MTAAEGEPRGRPWRIALFWTLAALGLPAAFVTWGWVSLTSLEDVDTGTKVLLSVPVAVIAHAVGVVTLRIVAPRRSEHRARAWGLALLVVVVTSAVALALFVPWNGGQLFGPTYPGSGLGAP